VLEIIDSAKSRQFKAAVVRVMPRGMVIEPEVSIARRPGQIGVARMSYQGRILEFDAVVIESADESIVLGHADRLRAVNRRRFPRVPVRRSAKAAPFPFVRDNPEEAPEYQAASVTELAGPGLKITAPVSVKVGDKVLVVLELSDGRLIQGIAEVRRLFAPEGERSVFAAEMTGLSSEETAELASETTAAALENVDQDSTGALAKEAKVRVLVPEGS